MSIAVRTLLASGLVAATAASGFAQTTDPTTGGGTTGGGTTGGGTTGGGGGTTGGSASGLQGGLGSAPDGGQALQLETVIGRVTSADAGGAQVSGSNPLAGFYANPLFQGRAGSAVGTAPGGFGQALYSTGGISTGVGGTTRLASGNAASATNRASGNAASLAAAAGGTGFGTGPTAGRTAAGGTGFGGTGTGRTGMTGFGTTGTTGFGGTGRAGGTGFGTAGTGRGGLGQNSGEIIVPVRALITTTTARLPTPVIAAPRMQADLREVLDRSSMLTNARGIELATDGRTVVLRGTVKDEDEARTVEGMIRLTPGVYAVRNELTYPTP